MLDLSGLSNLQLNMIDDILDNIDIGKIARYMLQNKWGWALGKKGEDGIRELVIPEPPDIRRHLREMLVNTYNRMNKLKQDDPNYDSCVYSSCGGFTVYVWSDDSSQVYFSIEEIWTEPDMFDDINDK